MSLVPLAPAATGQGSSSSWIVAGLLIGFIIILMFTAALAALLFLRRGSQAAKADANAGGKKKQTQP